MTKKRGMRMKKRDGSGRSRNSFGIHSDLFSGSPAIFHAQVVPDGKKTVKAKLKDDDRRENRRVLCCIDCDKWMPDGPGSYGYDLDGTPHFYGKCMMSGIPCKDNHFCSYARLRKE